MPALSLICLRTVEHSLNKSSGVFWVYTLFTFRPLSVVLAQSAHWGFNFAFVCKEKFEIWASFLNVETCISRFWSVNIKKPKWSRKPSLPFWVHHRNYKIRPRLKVNLGICLEIFSDLVSHSHWPIWILSPTSQSFLCFFQLLRINLQPRQNNHGKNGKSYHESIGSLDKSYKIEWFSLVKVFC